MSERARDVIVRQLRRMIVTGELAPGAVVGENHLAGLLGCGRTPLREALQQLTHEYLVAVPPRRGILIPQLSIVDFQQVHEALLTMDSAWTELAAQRINDQQLQHMKDVLAKQERANEAAEFYDLTDMDHQFHTLIAESTGNRYFADCTSRIHRAVARFVYRAYQTVGGGGLSIAEHRQILRALESRDSHLARQMVWEHSRKSSERCLDILGRGQRTERL